MLITSTNRITLRTWDDSDAAQAHLFYGDPEVSRFIGDGSAVDTIENTKKIILKFKEHHHQYGFGPWAVTLNETSKLIGVCGPHLYNTNQEPELGFRILKSHWNKGLATEACIASIDYGFNQLKFNKIIAFTHPENESSRKVLIKSNVIY